MRAISNAKNNSTKDSELSSPRAKQPARISFIYLCFYLTGKNPKHFTHGAHIYMYKNFSVPNIPSPYSDFLFNC